MATKAELQQEADELGIGEQTKGLNKAEMEEIIENFKNLEVSENAVEPLTDDLGDETLDERMECIFPEYEAVVDLEKLATQETINLIALYRNSRGEKGGDELAQLVRECVK